MSRLKCGGSTSLVFSLWKDTEIRNFNFECKYLYIIILSTLTFVGAHACYASTNPRSIVSNACLNDVLKRCYPYLKPNSLTLDIIAKKIVLCCQKIQLFIRFFAHLHSPYAVQPLHYSPTQSPLPLDKSPTQIVHNVTNVFTYLTHHFTTPYSLDFHAN